MKKTCTLYLTLLLQAAFLSAQSPALCPTFNHPGADACADACLHCRLQGYTGETAGFTAGSAPGFCSVPNNDQWLGFTAGADSIVISAMPSNCQQGDGLELALYADCAATPIACAPGQGGDGNQTRVLTAPLVPGQPYFLLINGYAGDECQFNLNVSPADAVYAPPVDPTGPMQGPSVVAAFSTLEYTVDSVVGATSYRWSGPPGCTINGQSPPVDIPAPAGRLVSVHFGDTGGILSVEGHNGCSAGSVSTLRIFIGQAPLAPPCPSSDFPAADICSDACVLCGFTQYMGSSAGYSLDPAPGFCGFLEHNQWIGFVAGATAATFTVNASNCIEGNGLQLALYQNCTDPPIVCNSGKAGGANDPLVITAPLQPGQNYFLMVDGYAGDECDFTLTVDPPMAGLSPALGTVGPISGPSELCPGATVTYSVPPLFGAAGYSWEAPPGWLINGEPGPHTGIGAGSNTITVTTGSVGGQVTVFAFNSCNAGDPVAKTITMQPIPPTVLPAVVVCAEDLPYELPWGEFCFNSGLYSTTLISYLGCDSIVRQQVTVKSPINTFLPPKTICAGDSVVVCGEVYTEPDTHVVVCESFQGCDSTVTFTLVVLEVQAEILPAQNPLCTTLPVVLNSTASVGTKVWRSLPTGAVLGTGNSITIDTPGVFTLTTTASAGGSFCIATDTVVIISGIPPLAAANGGILTCSFPNLMLDGSYFMPGVQFAWSGPNGFASNEEDPVVSVPGTYVFTVTDPQTGCTSSAVAEVSEDKSPPDLIPPDDVTINCANPTAVLQCEATPVPYNCFWAGPGGFTSILPDPMVSDPGIYILTVTNVANGCTVADTILVTGDFQIPVITAYADTITCTNPTSMVHCSTDIPGTVCSWTWDPLGNTILVIATAPNGCTATTTVQVYADATVPDVNVADDTLTCTQPTVTLACTTSVPNAQFAWSGPGNFSSSLQNPEVSQSGTYTVTVTDPDNGCFSVAETAIYADTDLPQIIISPPDVITCAMPTAILFATTNVPLAAFHWEGPNGFNSDLPNPEVNEPGVYTVTVTDLQTGCVASASTFVTSDIVAPPILIGPLVMSCLDSCIALPCAPFIPGISCCWSGPGIPPCVPGGPDPLACETGTYTLTVTGINGCTASASVTVVVEVWAPVVTIDADTLNCAHPSVTLVCTTDATAASFFWLGPAGATSTLQNPTVDMPGTYTVTVTDLMNGCTAVASVVVPEDIHTPEISLVQRTHDQNGQGIGAIDVTITHTGAYTVVWNRNGQFFSNSEDLSGLFAGNYELQVAGSNGCINVLLVTILDTIVSTQVVFLENLWTVFPNPANEFLHLQYTGTGQPEAQAWLLDAAGKVVFQQDRIASRTWTIPCRQLPPGTYTVLIRMEEGVVRKLVGVAR